MKLESKDDAIKKIIAAGKIAGWTGSDELIQRYGVGRPECPSFDDISPSFLV